MKISLFKIFVCYFIHLFLILVTLVNFISKAKIRYEYNRIDDPLKISSTGIPFILLGRQQYQCHQGKGINYKKKENYKETKQRKTYYWPYIYKTPKTGTGYKKRRMFSSLQYQETVYIPKV